MSRMSAKSLCYYDHAVSDMIVEKYGLDRMEALRRFVTSETHELLEDCDFGLNAFGHPGIFDIWEAEVVTGDPRNSLCIRGE